MNEETKKTEVKTVCAIYVCLHFCHAKKCLVRLVACDLEYVQKNLFAKVLHERKARESTVV